MIRGWGISMATDIASAVAALSLLGHRIPRGLKLFLSALAIADDLGAVLVIALFYTQTIQVTYLVAAGAMLGVLGMGVFWFFKGLTGESGALIPLIISMFPIPIFPGLNQWVERPLNTASGLMKRGLP